MGRCAAGEMALGPGKFSQNGEDGEKMIVMLKKEEDCDVEIVCDPILC